jgi:dTDP-glucose 4,6-dehydratase
MKLLVTGGAGFIGSNFVRHVLAEHAEDSVVVLDKLTYAGRMENLADHEDNPRFSFIHGAFEDREVAEAAAEGVDAIINFAAESHVDRSIEEPDAFIKTDVFGTQVLLEIARERGIGRYLQISTDEVYGSIDEGSFTELSPIDPSSPYSASKAGGDMLVQAYFRTYGLPALITRASNNYGPYHYPEKLIPLCVLNAFAGDSLPVYGNGMQVRNWLHVEDHCRGIYAALTLGKEGEVYNIGGPDECPNIEVVKSILELTGRDESLIEYVTDRPGHDVRYSLASDKLEALGWKAQIGFEQGLADTVQWYRDNEWWWKPIRSGEYLEYYKRQYGSTLGD